MEGVIDRVARGVAAADLEDDQLPQLRVPELREELRRRNLRVTGRKPELLARLRAALLVERDRVADNHEENIDDLVDDEEEDGSEDARAVNIEGLPGRGNHDVRFRNPVNYGREYNDEDDDDGAYDESAKRTPLIQRREESRVLLTFKDVEGSLEKFSGDDDTNVQQWLDDFEEMAELCKWNEIQKIVYAKRLLDGSAKMFVSYEKCAKTWKKLKESLKEQFEEAVDCLKIHRELSKRKKKSEETLQEYAYKMLQIASPAKLMIRHVIQYIIEGISDDVVNKVVLYGAKDFKQLKEKFGHYEKMKQEMSKSKTRPPEKLEKIERPQSYNQGRKGSPGGTVSTSGKKIITKCYNCGGEDHVSGMCPNKEKGKKCFKCGEFGHIANECTPKLKEVYLVSRPDKEKYKKEITSKDSKILALDDTGSDLKVMSMKENKSLGSPSLCNKQVCFEGLAAEVTETLGIFPTRINTVDETKELELSHNKEEHYQEEIKNFISNYKPEATRDVSIRGKIFLTSDKPVVARPRLLAPSERKEVNDVMNSCLEEGIIRPSTSEYASPNVLIKEVKFVVGMREIEAFGKLKAGLVCEPVLKLYRHGADTELYTDASRLGYGMILLYKGIKGINGEPLAVVPKSIKAQIIKRAHEQGHFDVTKTEAIVKKDFWFKEMRPKVEHVVTNCFDCILAERKQGKQEGLLREKIQKTKEEKRRGFNKHRKPANVYEKGDLIDIQRKQFRPGLKLKGKFLGPYRITKILRGDRFVVEKMAEHEGPQNTFTAAGHTKPWGMISEEGFKTTDVETNDDN